MTLLFLFAELSGAIQNSLWLFVCFYVQPVDLSECFEPGSLAFSEFSGVLFY